PERAHAGLRATVDERGGQALGARDDAAGRGRVALVAGLAGVARVQEDDRPALQHALDAIGVEPLPVVQPQEALRRVPGVETGVPGIVDEVVVPRVEMPGDLVAGRLLAAQDLRVDPGEPLEGRADLVDLDARVGEVTVRVRVDEQYVPRRPAGLYRETRAAG